MNPVTEKHEEAMDLAEYALIARLKGHTEEYLEFARQAYELEAEAANMLLDNFDEEPSRSILYRSAASLAMQCQKFREAEQLIGLGLGGNAPFEIAQELRELYDQVKFNRKLTEKDLVLSGNAFQITLDGDAVGYGILASDLLIGRLGDIQRLLNRTAERIAKAIAEASNTISKNLRSTYKLYLTGATPGSFGLSLSIAEPRQHVLPGFDEPSPVIDEFIECIQLFNNSQEDALRERIKDPDYYSNFVQLARKIAPDGDELSSIMFSTVRNGNIQAVKLTRRRETVTLNPKPADPHLLPAPATPSKKYVGKLLYADSQSADRPTLKIIGKNGKKTTIIVPNEMTMVDIVRPLWEFDVEVTGRPISKGIVLLIDITEAREKQ